MSEPNESDYDFVEMIRAARADREHLSFIDFPAGVRVTVRIEKVIRKTNVKSAGGRNNKEVYFLKFQGKDKLLWLSVAKLLTLGTIYEKDVKNWVGKDVVLYADPTVKWRGVEVGGIVIEAPKTQPQKGSVGD